MSEQNVEMLHQFFEAWNRRDFDYGARIVHDDYELHLIGGFADLVGEEFDGPEGVLRFSREIAETVGGRVKVERAVDLGERVAAVMTVEGAGVESGAPVTRRFGQIWSFRDGKVIRVDSYYDADQALEAAGLSE